MIFYVNYLQYTQPLVGEPLNVIVSALSDPFVLTEDGFHEYTKYVPHTLSSPSLHM